MAAADAYLAWIRAAVASLPEAVEALEPERRGRPSDLFDMDGVIAEHCLAAGEAEPEDVTSRMQLHLAILHRRLAELRGVLDE